MSTKRGKRVKRVNLRPTDTHFAKMVQRFRKEAHGFGRNLDAGKLTPDQWSDAIAEMLERAHAQAAFLGRQLSGDFAPFDRDDITLGQMAVDLDIEFLQRFEDKIKEGGYTDDKGLLRLNAIESRVELYLSKLRGTANEVFVLASDPLDFFAWEMVADEHCATCPKRAADGPYRADRIKFHPGDGSTDCLTNCGCIWVRLSDGQFGFSRAYVA